MILVIRIHFINVFIYESDTYMLEAFLGVKKMFIFIYMYILWPASIEITSSLNLCFKNVLLIFLHQHSKRMCYTWKNLKLATGLKLVHLSVSNVNYNELHMLMPITLYHSLEF